MLETAKKVIHVDIEGLGLSLVGDAEVRASILPSGSRVPGMCT